MKRSDVVSLMVSYMWTNHSDVIDPKSKLVIDICEGLLTQCEKVGMLPPLHRKMLLELGLRRPEQAYNMWEDEDEKK